MSKGLNAVENVLRGTKEYLWDDFWEHPEMSAGLVIMTALVYPMIKDNPIWTYTKWGVATTIGGAFLKRKFNVQPTERLAEVAERLGRQDIADGIRTTVQTMRDVAFGKEGEGTLNHYFYDKLDLHRDAERSAFNHLLQKKPKEFLAWYNEAKQWTLDRRPGRATSVRVPTAVANEARAMTRMQNVPDAVKAMNTEQKVDILLEASDKVLAHIAAMNPTLLVTPPGTTNEQKGLALLQKKYIDGSYFNLLWDRFEEANPIPTTLSPAIQDHLKRIRDEREKFYIGMAGAVQRGSDVIQFIDILLIENDADAITKFKGTGLTPEEIKKWWEWVLKEAKDKGAAAMAKAKELYEGGRTYWSTDVFPALKTAWTYDVAGRGSAEDLYKWMFAPDPALGGRSRADIALEKAIDLGKDTIEIAIDNPIVDLLKEAGIMAKDALVMTRDELVEFRKWLEEYRKIGKLLNTFDIDVDRARDMITWNLGSADALPLTGYHYRFTLTFHPIADAANPPPAGSAMPAPTVKIIDLSGSFSAARPAFTNAPLWINVSTSPAIPLHYKYHKVSVELEVQTGAGTTPITRSRMARQVSL